MIAPVIAAAIIGMLKRKKKDSGGLMGRSTDRPYVAPTLPEQAPVATPMAPPPPAPAGQDSQAWLSMALSALGSGPNKADYTQPYEAAAGRAQAANAQALPQIAAGYDRLRGELGTAQAGTDQAAQQAQAGMAAQQGQSQASIAAMVAPVLAQLQASGGGAALGSLTGALQAQVATGQAQVAQQGAAQTQLSQNLQQAGTQSAASRVADSQLAQQSAVTGANSNLAQVLNALDSRKAEATRQYGADASKHNQAIAQAKMTAADRQRDEPQRQMELERARIALEHDRMGLADARGEGPASQPNRYDAPVNDWHSQLSETNPTSYKFLTSLIGDGSKQLPVLLGEINSQAKGGKIRVDGKNLDATWLRDRLTELNTLMHAQSQEEARRNKGSR